MMTHFEELAPEVMDRLIPDLGIHDMHAAAIVGNFGEESGLEAVQERHPIAGRGGFGWAQWTGARRTYFDNYCKSHNLSDTSFEANYGYLLLELRGAYAHALRQLRLTTTLEAATQTFETYYEMAGVVALAKRIEFAHIALNAYRKTKMPPNLRYETAQETKMATEPAPAPAAPVDPVARIEDMAVRDLVGLIWPTVAKDVPFGSFIPESAVIHFSEEALAALVSKVMNGGLASVLHMQSGSSLDPSGPLAGVLSGIKDILAQLLESQNQLATAHKALTDAVLARVPEAPKA